MKGLVDDRSGIAYGVSLAVVTVFVLIACWVVLGPAMDGLRDFTVDANADNPDVFSDELVTRVNTVFTIWGLITISFIIVPFIFVIVRAIRKSDV